MPGLRRLAVHLTTEQAPARILRNLCTTIRETVSAELSAVAILSEAAEQLKLECISGQLEPADTPASDSVPLTLALLDRLASGEPVTPWDQATKTDLLTHLNQQGAITSPSFLGVHLKTPTKLYGILCLWRKVGAQRFTEDEKDVAQIAAELAAIAYENSLQRETLQALDFRLRVLTSQHMTEREQERHRISMAIHDDLGQDLTAVKIQLQLLGRRLPERKAEVVEQLTSIASSIDDLIQQVRRIATDLRLPVLNMGVVAAIRTHGDQFQARTGITCQVVASEDIDLDPARAIAVFRVFQESLTNVARHSEATKVKVTLTATADNLVLQVHDNGRGLSDHRPELSSLGILGMRERAAQFNGTLTVESRSKAGTTVTMNIPLI